MGAGNFYSSDHIDELTAADVVDATITDGRLILTRRDGSTIDTGPLVSAMPDATDIASGVVSLATDTETIDGTSSSLVVTPLALAALTATATRRGLIEIATSAEAVTATDTVRAITPATLNAVRVVTGIAETGAPSLYPLGESVMALSASSWSLNSGNGTVVTHNVDATHASQTFFALSGGTAAARVWNREYNSTGGWTSWSEQMLLLALTPASFTQLSAYTTYPAGFSRLYYTFANSSAWDFSGTSGEIITYYDTANNYAKQTFTRHVGGSSTKPDVWVRTANNSSGWSAWQIVNEKRPFAQLSGKVTITPSAANTPTSANVTFPAGYFTVAPVIVVSAETNVPGSEVSGVSTTAAATTGFTAWVRRSNTTATPIHWLATQS